MSINKWVDSKISLMKEITDIDKDINVLVIEETEYDISQVKLHQNNIKKANSKITLD